MIHLDRLGEAGFENRHDGIRHDINCFALGFLRPVLVFLAADQVAGVGKSRHPLVAVQHRIPADMIDMQMGADDRIDPLARKARFGDVLQEFRVQRLLARQHPGLIVADAGVHDELQSGRIHEQRVNGKHHRALGRDEMRIEPRHLAQSVGRGLLEEGVFRRNRQLRFHHPRDVHVADLPIEQRQPSHALRHHGGLARRRRAVGPNCRFAACTFGGFPAYRFASFA